MLNVIGGLALVIVAATATVAAQPAPWPQFRGPAGSGVADEQRPPVEIGPDKNVRWKVAVPGGPSSPIVVDDLLVLTAFEDGKLYTRAYSRADGSEVWRAHAAADEIEPYHQTEGSPAASTPATDGERIVSYFGSCGIYCYDLAGQQLWKYALPPAATMANFGTGVSPIIAEGKVVLLRDEMKDPKIMALDAATGSIVWERERESRSGFCTPVVWGVPGGKQIAAPGFGRMVGYNLATGAQKWLVNGMPAMCCSSPVIAGGDLYFAAWSPGDQADSEFKMPSFDHLLEEDGADANADGILSKEEAQQTIIKDFFDANDTDRDGLLTRDEWETMLEYLATSQNIAFALAPGGSGDITDTHVRWTQKKGLPYVPSPIVYRGQCVMVKDGGIITAYDTESGAEIYQKRAAASGSYYASPVAAGGHIYFTSHDDGTVTVLAGGKDKPTIVAANPPLGERVSASPAIADDTLYIRTAAHLYAFAGGDEIE